MEGDQAPNHPNTLLVSVPETLSNSRYYSLFVLLQFCFFPFLVQDRSKNKMTSFFSTCIWCTSLISLYCRVYYYLRLLVTDEQRGCVSHRPVQPHLLSFLSLFSSILPPNAVIKNKFSRTVWPLQFVCLLCVVLTHKLLLYCCIDRSSFSTSSVAFSPYNSRLQLVLASLLDSHMSTVSGFLVQQSQRFRYFLYCDYK